ncbi:MAG: discoidin domain-containing protein [Planctomycetaceae bacterium]|nr:discoidin domain-containing protein [Planctomycetaceae bacterium]
MIRVRLSYIIFCILALGGWSLADLTIDNEVQTHASLSNTVVYMTGTCELHLTSAAAPLSGCTVHLNSPDAWLFIENIKPSVVNTSAYLSQLRVSGAAATLNTNIRIVQYAAGAVVIPQPSTFQPLQVFTGENFQGGSAYLDQFTAYNTSSLGTMANAISSFILKRGYTATFAQNANGTGYSKNYVAQDCDLEIGVLPTKLNNRINFVRVFPWRWVSKKGIGGNIGSNLDIKWWYNWNLDQNSTLDKEYVPIRQKRWWPDLNQNWQTRGASQLLGYNEPDKTDQANMAVGDAIWSWPDLLWTGLRVGSPATSDGGRSGWLYPFIQQADAADLRVDFVAVHYYWCYDPANPSGAASQMYNYLKAVHDTTGRPIWVTEWNNGANWTGCGDPTSAQQAAAIGAMIDMLDSTSWVERYAIYNWVEDCRRVQWDDGWPTEAGNVYRDQVSPIGYRQQVPGSGPSSSGIYLFDSNFRDNSGNGNNPLVFGAPKRAAGLHGDALVLEGVDDHLRMPVNMGENADFTFAAWIYWNGGGQWQRIFDFGNDTTKYMFLSPASGGNTLRFAITTGGGSSEQRVETSALAVGQWVHVAVTLSGNVGRLYVNGTAAATNSAMTINPSDFQPSVNFIGKSQFSADPLFDGMLDDVVIADHALSDNAIALLAADNQPKRFIGTPLPIVAATAGAEETGNPAINSYDLHRATRWANDNTVPNAWIRYDLGAVRQIDRLKIRFNNGASRTYPIRIDIDGVQVFSGNTTLTSGYWEIAFAPVNGRYMTITMTGNNSAGTAWFSIWETQIWAPLNRPPSFNSVNFNGPDAVEGDSYAGGIADRASDPESGTLAFSKDAGPDWLTVAGDGALTGIPNDADTGQNVFTVRVTDAAGLYDTAQMNISVANVFSGVRGLEDLLGLASQWLTLDCLDTPACGGADLNDDADVTAADFSVLSHHWLADEDLQLYLKFDETGTTTAQDSSLYGRHGLLVNGPAWDSSGHSGGALVLDGTNDYVQITGYKGVTGSGPRTCTAWIKTTALSSQIISWGSTAATEKWMIRVNDNGTLRAEVQGGSIYGTTPIADGNWHHVAVVLADDGSADISEALLHVDGMPEPISGVSPCAVKTAASGDVRIGVNVPGNIFFQGLLDDVRVYDRALSEVEIQDLAQ